MTSTTTFPCQQCGGSATVVPGREYLQCEFCRSLVFTSDNPLSVDRITPMGDQLDAACPACQQLLHTGQVEDCPVLYCHGCFGLLLKNEDFGKVTRLRRARRERCESEPSQPLNTQEYDRKIACPNCRSQMEVHPYYGPGNIVIDSCGKCQFIWLDHGELRTVVRSEGGRIPEPKPMHVNEYGDVAVVLPEVTRRREIEVRQESPLEVIANILFGLS